MRVAKTKALISCAVYCTSDLRLCFRLGKFRFSHDAAHIGIADLKWLCENSTEI